MKNHSIKFNILLSILEIKNKLFKFRPLPHSNSVVFLNCDRFNHKTLNFYNTKTITLFNNIVIILNSRDHYDKSNTIIW